MQDADNLVEDFGETRDPKSKQQINTEIIKQSKDILWAGKIVSQFLQKLLDSI